jgi:teichuronic acid biosynthesis glycosyltransferase TuaG
MIEVSVITPSYNSESYIAANIESVINQTFINWEMIIVDDCSTDSTVDIIKSYCNKDSRIRYTILEKNSGSASAPRNKGISLAKGRFIAFLDSDDLWYPNKLELQINYMKNNNYPISYTSYEVFGSRNNRKNKIIRVIDYPVTSEIYLKNTVIGFSTSIIDRNYCPEIRMPDFVKEDALFWARLLNKDIKAYGLDIVLTKYRIHDKGISNNKIKMAKQMWQLYNKELKMPISKSLSYFLIASINKIRKDLF